MVDQVGAVNAGLLNYFTSMNFMGLIGWGIFILIVIGGCAFLYISWRNKKLFNKKTTDFEIVGVNFVPTQRDQAKTVKLGSGGFEILYLKKLKAWRLAYGGRVGKDQYYFFRMPDGYFYNAMLSAALFKVDELKGLIPVVTTNANMRSQYTSLEKQIDSLHTKKGTFMEKYGAWIFGIAFVLVAGVMLWLNYQEYAKSMASFAGVTDKMAILTDKLTQLAGNIKGAEGAGGLVPVK